MENIEQKLMRIEVALAEINAKLDTIMGVPSNAELSNEDEAFKQKIWVSMDKKEIETAPKIDERKKINNESRPPYVAASLHSAPESKAV